MTVKRDRCPHGHPYTRVNARGHQVCDTCAELRRQARPAKPDWKQVQVRFDDPRLLARIDRVAAYRGQYRNPTILRILAIGLANLEENSA